MKCVVITGAGSGIGQAAARVFSERGYRCILIGRTTDKLQATASTISNNPLVFAADLTDDKALVRLLELLEQKNIKSLSALVNSAGIYQRAPAQETSLADWRKMFEINLFAAATLTQALLPLLRQEASAIINVASTLGDRPVPATSIYSASKAAMINWSKCLALELASLGIRVNCVSPGIIDTPMHPFHSLEPEEKKTALDKMRAMQPMGRIGEAQEIAKAIYFLASADSPWTTGATLNVDGGINL